MTPANEFYLATLLLIVGALMVIYIRLKHRLESNIPILFFGALVAYVILRGGRVPTWISYAGLVLALLIRFEFMNEGWTRVVQVCEYAVLGIVIYQCAVTLLLW